MFGSGCTEALHRTWLRLGGGRPSRQTTAQAPPRGCSRQGAVAGSQARDCCRGCGIDRWGLGVWSMLEMAWRGQEGWGCWSRDAGTVPLWCEVFGVFSTKKDASLGERGRVVRALSPINPTSVLCRIFSPKGKSIVCRCPLCLQILSSLFRLSKTSIEPKRHRESQKNTCYRTGNGKALTTMMMRMRSDDGPFLAGQISPLPDSTWGSDWAVRQLSAEIKERLMRLRLPSTKTLPQHNPRARKQLGTGTKHQPMASIRKRFGINSPNRPSRQILPQVPRPGAPAVHEHRLTAAAPASVRPPGIHGLPRPLQDARTAVLTRRRPVVRPVHARARPWVSHRCSHR